MKRAVIAAALFALLSINAQAQGPIVLMGIDAEDAGHGGPAAYATVLGSVYSNATNLGSNTLVIGGGKNPLDNVSQFWSNVGTIGTVTFVNGAANIASASFAGYRMIGIASDFANTPSGGLTNAENDALTLRAADIAAFVNGGGGLAGFSSVGLNAPYGYLGDIGSFSFGSIFQDDITPTTEGTAIGVTDALDVCCWHDAYLTFPSFLNVLAYYPFVSGQPAAAIGGQQVIIPSTCPYGQGFWRNHGEGDCHSGNNADFWPANAFPMPFGSYSLAKADACEIIRLNSAGGNALRSLARQLIAAKLNIANGSPNLVAAEIAQADALIGAMDPRTADVKSNTALGQQMNALAGVLDMFNNNQLLPICVPPPAPSPKSGYTRPSELAAHSISIDGNYPNPVSEVTSISYTLKESGNTVLAIYNTLGAKVRSLVSRSADAGSYSVQWDGRDDNGTAVSNGTYYIKLMMDGQTVSTKLTIAR
jgi:hypothetical protein